MPISIGITPPGDPMAFQDYLVLDWELLAYFQQLARRPELDLSAIAGLDPYGDALFTGEQLPALAGNLETARRFLEAQYRLERLAPELEPPARTGLETDPEGEPCGRPGVLSFLATLSDLCRRAAAQKLAISALGD